MSGGALDKAVRVRITGRVQGVWYRGWTVEMAVSKGLRGWVRNRKDGSVEALFAGGSDKVDEMVVACEVGPTAARVAEVQVDSAEAPAGEGFSQLPTE